MKRKVPLIVQRTKFVI